jgi:hypothetical protein
LRSDWGLHRIIKIRNGEYIVGQVYHLHKGFIGIHVTLVEWVGGDRPYQRDKRCTVGACRGGAIWFGNVSPDAEHIVGEGIETVLSAMILWGAKSGCATLGTEGLKALVLPKAAKRVVIAADNDAPAECKRIGIGLRDAREARRLWLEVEPTKNVEIRVPPPPTKGAAKCDWNDVLMAKENYHG